MTRYEYKVVPTSTHPPRIKGVRDASERMRRAFEDLLNGLADQGWEYVRRDVVTVEARPGLLRRKEMRDDVVLIFRRALNLPLSAQAAGDALYDDGYAQEDDPERDDRSEPHSAPSDDWDDPGPGARHDLRGERPDGGQSLSSRRLDAARQALRGRTDPPLSARREDEG